MQRLYFQRVFNKYTAGNKLTSKASETDLYPNVTKFPINESRQIPRMNHLDQPSFGVKTTDLQVQNGNLAKVSASSLLRRNQTVIFWISPSHFAHFSTPSSLVVILYHRCLLSQLLQNCCLISLVQLSQRSKVVYPFNRLKFQGKSKFKYTSTL